MYKKFVLYQGYAESQSLASVSLIHQDGFTDVLDALENLRQVFLSLAQSRVRSCCVAATGNYCSTCGMSLQSLAETGDEGAAEEFVHMWQHDIDGASSSGLLEALEAAGWDLMSTTMTVNAVCVYKMDEWIAEGGGLDPFMFWASDTEEGSTYQRKAK